MAPLLRHPVGELPTGAPSSNAAASNLASRRPALSTLVSHEGPHGDRSFLLIRERPGPVPSGERLVLRGDFGASLRERLGSLLAALPADRLPLHVDLRRVTALDEGCLSLLLKAQRDLAPRRAVVFLVAEAGPVRQMVRRLGLEKTLGVEQTLGVEDSRVSKAGEAQATGLASQRPKLVPAEAVTLQV